MKTQQKALAGALLALALGGPAAAQQTLNDQAALVRVEGLNEVVNALQRVEQKLDRLLISRWEYRAVQRNRLDDVSDVTAALGRDGWELVAVTIEEGFIFKRRVPAQ